MNIPIGEPETKTCKTCCDIFPNRDRREVDHEAPWSQGQRTPYKTLRFYQCVWCERCESIPKAFRWASLESGELAQRVGAKALALAKVWARDVDALRRRMVFIGPAGSGKTSLAAALFRQAMHEEGGLFVLAWRLGLCRTKFPLGQGDPPDLLHAMSQTLLVLDDVGTEPGSVPNPIAEVLFERHAEDLPTWVTTGLTIDAAAARYGDGIARRIYEGALVLDCGAP